MSYFYGRRKERQVGEFLERRQHACYRSPGSKGPVDLFVKKGRRLWAVQVKSTRKRVARYTACLTPQAENLLIRYSRSVGGQPVLAIVIRNHVWFLSVPDARLLLEGQLRSLRYFYDDK